MAKVERPVTAHLIIQHMCQELHMTEEQLLVHLAVESVDKWLSVERQTWINIDAARYHRANVFVIEVER